MRKVCMYCPVIIDEGQPGDETSHGVCAPCVVVRAEIQRIQLDILYPPVPHDA